MIRSRISAPRFIFIFKNQYQTSLTDAVTRLSKNIFHHKDAKNAKIVSESHSPFRTEKRHIASPAARYCQFGMTVLSARAKITSHSLISPSGHLRPIFFHEILKITSYSCGFAHQIVQS